MKRAIILHLFLSVVVLGGNAQKTITLDNWFNYEIKLETGKVYHYTWDDESHTGFSQLGAIFNNRGAVINVSTTKPDSKFLKGVDVYIIVDPDSTNENPDPNYVEEDDMQVFKKWVKKGGVLLLMANDGPNCEFTHFNHLAKVFGFYFNPITLNGFDKQQYEMGAEANLPVHPLFNNVSKIFMKWISPIILSKNAVPVLTDEKGNVLIAETNYGKGYVLAIGDPWLYNEYIDHSILPESFENLKAANNLVDLLLEKAK